MLASVQTCRQFTVCCCRPKRVSSLPHKVSRAERGRHLTSLCHGLGKTPDAYPLETPATGTWYTDTITTNHLPTIDTLTPVVFKILLAAFLVIAALWLRTYLTELENLAVNRATATCFLEHRTPPASTDAFAVDTYRRDLQTCEALGYAHHFTSRDFLELIALPEMDAVNDGAEIIEPKH